MSKTTTNLPGTGMLPYQYVPYYHTLPNQPTMPRPVLSSPILLRLPFITLLLLTWIHSADSLALSSVYRERVSPVGSLPTTESAKQPGEGPSRRKVLFVSANVLASAVLGSFPPPAEAAYIDPTTDMPTITDKVYLDIAINGAKSGEEEYKGRLEIGLFGDAMPRATRNFQQLCANNGYAGSSFYRVLSDFTIQGGALNDPTGQSSTAEVFEPDNFSIKHTKAGLVSAVRHDSARGADSRFFIQSQDDAAWADDRYAAFGIVLNDGVTTVVKRIEQVPVKRPQNRPTVEVRITGSGVL